MRPGVTPLLDYLFTNHVVMVYSSAQPANVEAMVEKLIHPKLRSQMAGIWARDKLDLNKNQYKSKIQVYKKLDKVWNAAEIRAKAVKGKPWNQSNTVLVDDSHLKALAQPHNLVQVTEFENNAPTGTGPALRKWQNDQQAILKSLEQKLEELKWQVDVSRLIRAWQTGERQAPGVIDETVDQKTQQHVEEQKGTPQPEVSPVPSVGQAETVPGQSHGFGYPTPKSPNSPDINTDTPEVSTIDVLESEIDRQLQSTTLDDSRRSESPIDESVFRELLEVKVDDAVAKEYGTAQEVPPTPESMGA
jgi:hypothetical protein